MSRKKQGNAYYRGWEQFENPEAFDRVRADEFPARETLPGIDRRSLLKLAGGAAALATLGSGCRFQPQRKIVPFVHAPDSYVPGKDKYFASAATLDGYATGILVRSYEGRPVKIEGNPHHPSSLGACNHRTMAETAVMYDPERLQAPSLQGSFGTWGQFFTEALAGGKLALLTGNVSSPALHGQIQAFLQRFPGSRWFQYDAANRDSAREGAVLAFGRTVETIYDFERADVVLGLDADLFIEGPGTVAYGRAIVGRRDPEGEMNRLYAVESAPTTFGATADHRYPAKPSEVLSTAKAIAAALGVPGSVGAKGPDSVPVMEIVADLKAAGSRAVVVPGEFASAAVHACCHAINHALGAVGTTVRYTEPVLADWQNNSNQLRQLASMLEAGEVQSVLIFGGNPVYAAPGDVKFAEALAKAPFSAHLTLADNETSAVCRWALPASHFLEAWGDGKGHDGSLAVVQPLIEPMYDSKSEIEVLETLLEGSRSGERIVAQGWGLSPKGWKEMLARGVSAPKGAPSPNVSPIPNLLAGLPDGGSGTEVRFLPDPNVHDGRYSNVAWLQELPKPVTNLTWDNSIQVSPATAKKLGAGQQTKIMGVIPFYGAHDIVRLTVGESSVEGPIFVNPGMADDTVVVHMGYGRTRGGAFGTVGNPETHGGGFDVMKLRGTDSPWLASGTLIKAKGSYPLANTQFHNTLDVHPEDSGRDIIREVTLAAYREHPDALAHPSGEEGGAHHEDPHLPKLLYNNEKEFFDPTTNYQWAMTVDLNLCTGCNACVTACQAENNIPTVQKEQVMNGREMHWIRVDRYYRANGEEFDEANPRITFQPVACQQCDAAPCEPVCPVAATVHSHEGLNQMVYNRCVGTRYCSNNCPYKVRRFNFLHFTKRFEDVSVLHLMQNPDVSVRGRGVMEKCTYCVHRINHARIEAKKEEREIRDGEVVTACQQACPTGAIVFGDMRRESNAVAKTRASRRNYMLLEETNSRPRTTYLGKVRNPNPALEA
ncbi:MAG: 4Fe-4S dicluster domain-containing protein [Fimbriimonadaceae bacterium]|nr:4Fe-4S dicluster domain-containing protein [Fimbriimonadaceae bacterium]